MYNKNLRRAIFWCAFTFCIGQISIFLVIDLLVKNDIFGFSILIPVLIMVGYYSALSFYVIPYKWMRMPTMDFYYRQLATTFVVSLVIVSLYFLGIIGTTLTSGQFVVPFVITAFFPLNIEEWVQSHLKKQYRLPNDATNFQFKKRMEEVLKGEIDIFDTPQ